MASNVFTLTVRRGPDEGQSFTLTDESITIGRDPIVDIVLNDPEISRQHARLTRVDDGYQIQDLGSTNGTFVDGKRMGGDHVRLSPGMVITMGSNVTLVYRAEPDPAATVISPEADIEAPEAEEASVEEEAPVVEAFETPIPEPVEPSVEEDEATSLEFPPVEEPEVLPPAEEDTGDLPSFESPGEEGPDDQRTVLDMETEPPLYDFGAAYDEPEEVAGDELPSFGQEEEQELPSFEDVEAKPEPSAYTPQPESIDRSPPPPPPPSPPEQKGNRNRNVAIAIVILLLLLCCCCLLLYAGWTYGDLLLNELQIQ